MLHIRCKNNNITKSFPEGTSLADVYQAFASELNFKYPVVSAKVNNASQGLKFRLYQNRVFILKKHRGRALLFIHL